MKSPLLTMLAVAAASLSTISASIAEPPSPAKPVSRTYRFSEGILSRDALFTVPSGWRFVRHTLPKRALSRDGDIYEFQLAKSEKIFVTLMVASRAQQLLFQRESVSRCAPIVLKDGSRGVVETQPACKAIWIKQEEKCIVIAVDAHPSVMKSHRGEVQALIKGILLAPKPKSVAAQASGN